MRIALFDSARDDCPKSGAISWDSLARELLKHERTLIKDGKAWSPVDYRPGAGRGNAGVRAVEAAVFDLDHATPDRSPLEGRAYVLHSTFSHSATNPSFRLIFPLSRPCLPAEWPKLRSAIIADLSLPADEKCKDLAHLYYFPAAKPEAPVVAERGEGDYLDVDAYLASGEACDLASHSQPEPVDPVPVRAFGGPLDLAPLRQALNSVKAQASRRLAQIIIAGQPLAEPGARDDTINRAASLVANCAPAGTPRDTCLVLLEPCIKQMTCEPEGEAFWLAKAAGSYDRAVSRRAERERQDALERKLIELPAPPGNPPGDWKQGLIYTRDRDGNPGGLAPCGANADLIFRHDPRWAGKLRFNEVTKQLDPTGSPIEGRSPACLDVEAANWLARSEYRLLLKTTHVGEQMLAAGRRMPLDPLADYLNSQVWDSECRIAGLLEAYFGALGDPSYLRLVSRRWLLSAVARGLSPGCKVDTVLILEGPQGAFKSTAISILCGEFFADTKLDLSSKDSRILASMRWMVEIQELAALVRSDDETAKGFFSTREDYLRPPFGRVLEPFPRRCVFVGTTNGDEYLDDPTGGRRFWAVRVGRIDLAALRADRDQLWAEAVALFRAAEACLACAQVFGGRCEAHRWWFDASEKQAEIEAAARTKPRARMEAVLSWFLRLSPDARRGSFTTTDIAENALHCPAERLTQALRQEIGYIMKQSLRFSKHHTEIAGVQVWVYKAPENLISAAQRASPLEIIK